MYVITGATGNTGKPLALALLNAGKQVRVISRDENKAADLKAAGAEVVIGDSTDAAVLNQAFAGATAVYAMIPPNYIAPDFYNYQTTAADAIAGAVVANNVPYVVTLSSVGAHLPEKAGVVQGLHYMETRLNQLEGVNVLHLRPTYFMENTLGMAPLAKMAGIIGSPVNPDLTMNMIATRDIADYAAKRLLALDFNGKSHQDLLGSRDISYGEVAKVYGQAIGKPELMYVTVPSSDMHKMMLNEWGVSESLANNMIQFIETMNEGQVLQATVRNAESTTPTSIEDFAQVFKAVYNS